MFLLLPPDNATAQFIMQKLVNWFYPKTLDTKDLEVIRQGRIIIGFALALSASFPGYILLFYMLGSTEAAMVEALGMLVTIVYLLYIRQFGFSSITVHLGLLLLLSILLGLAYFSGGNRSPVLVWITVIPYVALYVLNRISALVWMILSFVLLVTAYISWHMEIKLGYDLEPEKVIILSAFMIIGVLLTFFFLGLMAISAEHRANKIIETHNKKSLIIREAIDESGDGIILFDSAGGHFYQNRVLSNLLEIEWSEKLDQTRFVNLFVDRIKVGATLKNAYEGISWSGELELATYRGKRLPVMVRINTIMNDSGACQALIAFVTDITKQKESEKTLRENETKYKLVAENTTDAIWLRDLSLNLVYMSPSIEKMRGYTPQELIELPLEENLTPESLIYVAEKLEAELEAALENPDREVTIETENYCKDGSTIWVEDSIKFLTDEYGKPFQMIGITRNITERKTVEESLKAVRAEMIENAHRAGMADIAADTLHNVGNLLNSVNTSAHSASEKIAQFKLSELRSANQFLKETFGNHADFTVEGSKGEKIIEYYTILEEVLLADQSHVIDELKRLREKIDSITDVIASQQRFAGFSGLSEKYSLDRLITDVLEIELPTLISLGIQVEKAFESIPDISIQKTKLLHILINLIKNAEDALLDNPKQNRNIIIKLEKTEKEVLIKVTDNGAGVSEENQQKIFNHGFTTKPNGYGFGLHSCAIYMDDMNGKIWMQSEGLRKGTTFFLSLPLATS